MACILYICHTHISQTRHVLQILIPHTFISAATLQITLHFYIFNIYILRVTNIIHYIDFTSKHQQV